MFPKRRRLLSHEEYRDPKISGLIKNLKEARARDDFYLTIIAGRGGRGKTNLAALLLAEINYHIDPQQSIFDCLLQNMDNICPEDTKKEGDVFFKTLPMIRAMRAGRLNNHMFLLEEASSEYTAQEWFTIQAKIFNFIANTHRNKHILPVLTFIDMEDLVKSIRRKCHIFIFMSSRRKALVHTIEPNMFGFGRPYFDRKETIRDIPQIPKELYNRMDHTKQIWQNTTMDDLEKQLKHEEKKHSDKYEDYDFSSSVDSLTL